MTVFIEYFKDSGADYPLVLLYGSEPGAVSGLREAVDGLATGKIERVAVHELRGFESVGGCRLVLAVGGTDEGVFEVGAPKSFECLLTRTTWWNIEGLLEPFSHAEGFRGFQWLDRSGEIALVISAARGW